MMSSDYSECTGRGNCEWCSLGEELRELERTDPDVAAAAASYHAMVEKITGKAIPDA